MKHTISILELIKQLFGVLLVQIHVQERSCPSAYLSYEKKGRYDYQKKNKIHLRTDERLAPSALLRLKNCQTIEDAIQALDNGTSPQGYLVRVVYLWFYYEHIDLL